MYDDFDFEIKNSATILSNALFDYFLANVKKISKISNIVKSLVKKIPEF